jgi:hypothetical protein
MGIAPKKWRIANVKKKFALLAFIVVSLIANA